MKVTVIAMEVVTFQVDSMKKTMDLAMTKAKKIVMEMVIEILLAFLITRRFLFCSQF